mmetsp:Transcript_16076/g.54904  ORF Transcript_16076/g.54904 Transcript_16076/m.54904 type:complete len:225 (-) Transcript_16076:592-1266(-)
MMTLIKFWYAALTSGPASAKARSGKESPSSVAGSEARNGALLGAESGASDKKGRSCPSAVPSAPGSWRPVVRVNDDATRWYHPLGAASGHAFSLAASRAAKRDASARAACLESASEAHQLHVAAGASNRSCSAPPARRRRSRVHFSSQRIEATSRRKSSVRRAKTASWRVYVRHWGSESSSSSQTRTLVPSREAKAPQPVRFFEAGASTDSGSPRGSGAPSGAQ